MRTAYDLGRQEDLVEAVVALDRLANRHRFAPDLLLNFTTHYRGGPGTARLCHALAHANPYTKYQVYCDPDASWRSWPAPASAPEAGLSLRLTRQGRVVAVSPSMNSNPAPLGRRERDRAAARCARSVLALESTGCRKPDERSAGRGTYSRP